MRLRVTMVTYSNPTLFCMELSNLVKISLSSIALTSKDIYSELRKFEERIREVEKDVSVMTYVVIFFTEDSIGNYGFLE